jgi:DUF1680 family protein
MKRILLILGAIVLTFNISSAQNYISNRAPLLESNYMELPIGDIKAEGWLLLQLQAQRTGLTGNLDEVYPNVVGDRNAWLGGDGDAWERGPYWIDGLLPLAYQLNDKDLIAKANRWVECILNSQKENGYFGPDTDRPYEPGLQRGNSHDWWPKMVALKILKQHYMATKDPRVIPFLDKYFRYQLEMLPSKPLDNWTFWGAQRGGDNLDIVHWLYNITGEKYLLELGELIHKQTTPWTEYFHDGEILRTQNNIHCVNLAQGYKEPIVYYQQSKDVRQLQAMKNGGEVIRKYIGLATGLWAGDELLNYGSPNRGSELCTAIEMMYSLETMMRITGDTQWADYLERVAYNALPTQTTDDFTTRQYYQQSNQIACTRNSYRTFSTPHTDVDVVFGVLTGYPCCTCNMHQGWPKFTQNLWYATDDNGLAAMVFAPSSVKAKVADGVQVEVKEETFYPFDETIKMTLNFPDKKVKEAFFPLKFRIPGWCEAPIVKVNGEVVDQTMTPGCMVALRRTWKKGDVVTIELPMEVKRSNWYDNSVAIERGPLLYALKLEEKWERKEVEPESIVSCGTYFYEVTTPSKWNYCLTRASLKKENFPASFELVRRETDRTKYPWNLENAPLVLKVKARELKDWAEFRGSACEIPFFTQQGSDVGEEEVIELIPYGCTTLRISQFPVR